MSAREAILEEIKIAPESLVRETDDFLLSLKRRQVEEQKQRGGAAKTPMPGFLARPQAMFGSRHFEDSAAILDELRADRY